MKAFTLSSALNTVGKHLIISLGIFVIAYWSLPKLDLIDEKHQIKKIIDFGESPNGHPTRLLDFLKINEILGSNYINLFLAEKLGADNVAKFTLVQGLVGDVYLTFQGRRNTLAPTASVLIKKLQEYDQERIEIKYLIIDRQLKVDIQELENFKSSMADYVLTPDEVAYYAKLQKKYDKEYDGLGNDRLNSSAHIGSFIRLKNDDVDRSVNMKGAILSKENLIEETQFAKSQGFKTVDYLFPVADEEITKYYPNSILFFGISLILALFYNLILLTYQFRKSVK